MKLSLRNLALGAILTAGAASAATPTVKLDWTKEFSATEVTYNESRYGTGFGDKVYWVNKAGMALYCYDHATDAISKVADLPGTIGVGLTTDAVGNILISGSWAGADGTKYFIVSPEGEVTSLSVELPDGVVAGRMDFLGRAAGNLLGEGGMFYVTPNGNSNVAMVNVIEGAQNTDDFSFYSSNTTPAAFGTNTIANPLYTYEELVDMGDDAVNACAWRTRNSFTYIYDGEWKPLTKPAGQTSCDGFDVFQLDGVDYQVVPTSTNDKYNSGFSIATFAGEVIYTDYAADRVEYNPANSYTNGSAIIAHKVDENTVEIYTWYPMNGKHIASKFTVSLAAEPAEAPLYACGTINDWNPQEAVEMPYADGKWTLDLGTTASAAFKISTTKGPWDPAEGQPEDACFNHGVLGIADKDTPLEFGVKTPLVAGAKGNITVSGKGTYVVEVTKEGENYFVTLAGELAPIEAPEYTEVFLRGDFDSWGADPAYKFNDAGVEGSARKYTLYVKESISGQFKIGDASANWTVVNFGGEEGSTITVGPKYKLVQNGQNLKADNLANVTFIFMHSGDPKVASTLQLKGGDVSVEDLELAEDAPATYYNLQGVEVNAENLTSGVYVKVAGGKASKVLVK